jgi:hypothetical protein
MAQGISDNEQTLSRHDLVIRPLYYVYQLQAMHLPMRVNETLS